MPVPDPRHGRPATRRARAAAAVLLVLVATLPAGAQTPPAAAPATKPAPERTPPASSALDAPLFYQLLIGEIELRSGQAGTAYEVILDAARRTREEALFRRAMEIALQARAGDQALAATRAWRQTLPQSADALRSQLQILIALNRPRDTVEPLRALLAVATVAERGGLIASLPRFYERTDPAVTEELLQDALAPWRDVAATRLPVRLTLARVALARDQGERALALAREAAALEPGAIGPALLGLELMATQRPAESLVTDYLARPEAENALRLAYVRALSQAQRYAEAVVQLDIATRLRPDEPLPFLSLGALQLELKHPREADAALRRYVELVQRAVPAVPSAAPKPTTDPAPARTTEQAETVDDDEDGPGSAAQGLTQAWLMLAQAADQRGDFKAAEDWLARVDDPKRALEVQTRRATLLARQGKLAQARELIRQSPEREASDARAKLLAEAGVLREVKRWRDAFEVLASANQRYPGDADLLYEQAMMAEKTDRIDEMEQLLRRVIELKPDSAHAHNALGYSLADRSRRLPEARELIKRALELAPNDPFITDSLGWVEYRLGNREEALRLLRQAYAARPDPEIGAHLGEVLWAMGQRDEARRIWRESRGREPDNEVLRETLARLRAEL